MSRPVQIFLAHCFEPYQLTADGVPDEKGVSNREIGEWFRKEIERLGGQRVTVVTPSDPLTESISEAVKRSIEESDAAICIFPKRVRCPYQGWTTSQYVVSESAYAACRFRLQANRKLFGFVEDGVNRANLGVAFPSDKAVPMFRRDRLDDMRGKLAELVHGILSRDYPAIDKPEPILLNKSVLVRRNGWALIETLHRFRVRRETTRFHMPHTLWRVRERLPEMSQMLETCPSGSRDYFKFVLRACGAGDVRAVQPKITIDSRAEHGKEIPFSLDINNVTLKPGDEVEYQFAWSYGNAFLPTDELEDWEKNSVGIRTGSRGPVREVILTVLFERNWQGSECAPCIEQENGHPGPKIEISNETSLPGRIDPVKFWHQDDGWQPAGFMERRQDLETVLVEAYQCRRENFAGVIKTTWQPTFNYHDSNRRVALVVEDKNLVD